MRLGVIVGYLMGLLMVVNGAPATAPLRHGVVFFLPPTAEEAVTQLAAIRADGYNMVKIPSWVWTVPTEGSELRKTVQAALEWCDANGMAVWLLHNIQWGSPGEGGDVEAALDGVTQKARETLEPWAEVLKGHPCVMGVLLGNEVGPGGRGLFEGRPRFLKAFRDWLQQRHGDLDMLNRRWGTQYKAFGDVQPPQEGERGSIDVQRFCRERFAAFYDGIVAQVLKPVLGEGVLYGSKGGASPFILRQMPHYTVCSWDDLLANWSLWKTKLLVDTTRLPVFNSELHLYNDHYAYGPSVELSRYRYLTSALLGEWMTASYAWGQWRKPEIAKIHAATPGILADLRKLEPVLRAFNGQEATFEVLVTEANEEGLEGHPPLELAYAYAAATGLEWRFVVDAEIASLRRGRGSRALDGAHTRDPLVVDSPWLTRETAERLAEVAEGRRLVFVGRVPTRDEYGVALPEEAVRRLRQRAQVIEGWEELGQVVDGPHLPAEYREVVDVPYLWWSPEKGHYSFPVQYPRLEARRAGMQGRAFVAVVNHTQQAVTAPVAFAAEEATVTDALTGEAVDPAATTFAPLAVSVFEVAQASCGH